MPVDKLQTSRFELKFLIDEEIALRVREFVRAHLDWDENSAGKPDFSYPVHSLYLDSDDLKTYWATINGDKNRFKLRLRFYNNQPESPVFFEIKRRMNNCIMKQRGAVRREAVDWLLAGHLPEPGHLVSPADPKQLPALENFCHLLQQLAASPKAHIGYLREAFVPHDDNSTRLTMDRLVRAEVRTDSRLSTDMDKPVLVWGKEVVLELKFTNRFPGWFGELVRVFGLRQCGAAKYVDGLALLGEYKVRPRERVFSATALPRGLTGGATDVRLTSNTELEQ